ncbi:putative amino acid aldolase or racemase [Mycobacterium sp. JS623]|uniref:alanine racemase n=1 Tax=Mycobacterium sp. JS623 TaxID=212767 RepID=UPI0002A5A8E8|nr:alanine racemase [Mycobacterium sp. JS623]AGB21740.1 putative amino acid aldolase or racemase [Mycobacterium sp. JS623]
MDPILLNDLRYTVVGPQHKSLPPTAWGLTVDEFLATTPHLSQFATPLLTLDETGLSHNISATARWASERNMLLAPHGKTTMAPQLWRRQLEAGAWAITLATPWQAQLARRFGVGRIMLANAVVDAANLTWLTDELSRDPDFEFYCWADSVTTVELMTSVLDKAPRPVAVLIELGFPGGRCGARTIDEAVAVAEAIAQAPNLTLAGVAGYEGALGHDRSPGALTRITTYLDDLAGLYGRLQHLLPAGPLLTAGGSAYPDLVAERFANAAANGATVVLRSGAYITHDDGFYAHISPFADSVQPHNPVHLQTAIHGWARVISTPEPELALLDAGKRDLPYDEGLPVVGHHPVAAMNDQHTFVRGAQARSMRIGDIVRLGLSHPCTAFDKWRLIPVIADYTQPDPPVVDLVHTFF